MNNSERYRKIFLFLLVSNGEAKMNSYLNLPVYSRLSVKAGMGNWGMECGELWECGESGWECRESGWQCGK